MTDVSQAAYVHYTALSKLIVFRGFLLDSYSRNINVVHSLRCWSLKLAIIPWSIGCQADVVFGGSHATWTCERLCKPPNNCTASSWPEKLSINNRTFLPSLRNLLLIYCDYSLHISPVIHLDLLNLYIIRRFLRLILLKHRGFSDLLITQAKNFSLISVLLVNAMVIRSLVFFILLQDYVAKVRSGVLFQFRPVSSILRILRSSYSLLSCRTASICAILSRSSITAEPAFLYWMYSLILYCFLNPSSYLFDYFWHLNIIVLWQCLLQLLCLCFQDLSYNNCFLLLHTLLLFE